MEQVSNTGCHGAKSQPSHGAMQGLEGQINGLRKVGRYFFQRGWSVGTSSNYSVIIQQQPLQLLLTASGMDKGQLKADDFVRVNDQGQQVAILIHLVAQPSGPVCRSATFLLGLLGSADSFTNSSCFPFGKSSHDSHNQFAGWG